jgi:hypothetical protein
MMNEEKSSMSRTWTLKYGTAAVVAALTIIAVSLLANPLMLLSPSPTYATASFTVMLTDPPTVPAGTTLLNLTYSDVALHVAYPNGTVAWLPVTASGTVNLFALINMSQTLATITLPINSTVDKIQFTIDDVEAVINGATYNVTALSNTLVINVADGYVNETLSGVLLDFNPTLVQIQATDADGVLVDYYVLVPSATAVVVKGLSADHLRVGTIIKIGENHRVRLMRVVEKFKKNVTIVSASLSVHGNTTELSVTLQNDGDFAFRVFGLTLHGEFNATRNWERRAWDIHHRGDWPGWLGRYRVTYEMIHPRTIPFKANGSSLVPLFGTRREHAHDLKDTTLSALTLQPEGTVTLTFSGVIALQTEHDDIDNPAIVITPIAGETYTLRLMGEGFQTFTVTATS